MDIQKDSISSQKKKEPLRSDEKNNPWNQNINLDIFSPKHLKPLISREKIRVDPSVKNTMDIVFNSKKTGEQAILELAKNSQVEEMWVFIQQGTQGVWIETWDGIQGDKFVRGEGNLDYTDRIISWTPHTFYHTHPDFLSKYLLNILKKQKNENPTMNFSFSKENPWYRFVSENIEKYFSIYAPSPEDFYGSFFVGEKWWISKVATIFWMFEYGFSRSEPMISERNKLFASIADIQERADAWKIIIETYHALMKAEEKNITNHYIQAYKKYRTLQFIQPEEFCKQMSKEGFYMKFSPSVSGVREFAIEWILKKFNTLEWKNLNR